jgi:hypothetical protein
MAETTEKLNLYQKLAAISGSVGSIAKTGTNQSQNYSFIEQAQVISTLKPLLEAQHIVIMPEIVEHNLVQKEKGAKVIVHMKFTVVDGDNPDDRFEANWYAEGDDTLDKATSKAGTSGEKYFLMKLFKISDRDDPDAQSTETGNFRDAQPMRSAAKTTPVGDKQVSAPQLAKMYATLSEKGFNDKAEKDKILKFLSPKEAFKDLTMGEGSDMITKLMNSSKADLQLIVDGAE